MSYRTTYPKEGGIIVKEWSILSFKWRLERHRYRDWYYLLRDSGESTSVVAEGKKQELLKQGWYE